MGKPVIPIAFQFTQEQIDAGDANNLPKGTSISVTDATTGTGILTARGNNTPPVESVNSGNINTVLAAAGGAGWNKVQATTASYVITRPTTGAGLDLHIESGGSLAAITSVSWPVLVNGVDQLRIRNFSGSTKTFTAGTGWTIVTADGNPITGGSYSIPDDRAIEVTLDPHGFAQVVPWGGEVSEATFNVHTGNVSNPHSVSASQIGLGSVNNTSDISKPVSTAQQTALNLKQDASTAATDAELTAHTGNVANPHVVTKTQVGLGNVDNTADTAKPVSTAQQTVLDAKAPLASPTFTGTVSGITKAMVGLGSAENTSDASKPVSTAQQTALDGKSATTHAHTGTYEPADATILKEAEVVNTLVGTATNAPLSAAQGKALQDGKQELYEGTVALRTPNNLTSNTSNPNYILTASSEHTIHLFYRAFDNNDTTLWYTAGVSVATGVIELNYKIRPTNLLLRGDVATEYWTRWQLQGSKDGTNWDTLVDRSGVDEEIRATSKNFSITTSKEYKHFRFNGLGAVGTNIPISRLEISGVAPAKDFTDWTSYTPIVTSESGAWSNYTATGRYRIIDRMLTVSFRILFSNPSSAADALYVSLPSGLTMNATVMTGGAGWDVDHVGFGLLGDSGVISGVPAIITTRTNQKVLVKYYNAAAGSYLTALGLNNTTPWTWTLQDTIDGQFTVPIT